MINYLTKSRADLEDHFHDRTQKMLNSVERYEQANLTKLVDNIGKAAIDKVNAALADPEQSKVIKESAFQSALLGLRAGIMSYENDPILPILQEEIVERCSAYSNLTPEDESAMLCLKADQKKVIADADKREKNAFLTAKPKINNPSVTGHEKYKQYVENLKAQ